MSNLVEFIVVYWVIFIINSLNLNDKMLFASMNTEFNLILFVIFIIIGSIASAYPIISKGIERKFILSATGIKVVYGFAYINLATLILISLRVVFYKLGTEHNLTRLEIYSPFEVNRILSGIYVLILFVKSLSAVFVHFVLLKSLLNRDTKWLFITLSLVVFDAILFSAKGPFVALIFIACIWLLIDKNEPFPFLKRHKKIVIALCLLFFIPIYIRGDNLFNVVSSYFSIGPVLLSNLVDDNSYAGSMKGWDFSSILLLFSGLEYLYTILIRGLFDINYQSEGYIWMKITDIPVVVSMSSIKFIPYNTFYTILAEPYLALGSFGVSALGFLMGYIISLFERRYLISKCDFSLFILSYICVILLSGVFNNPIGSVTLWLVIILFLIFQNRLFDTKTIAFH